MPRGCILTYVSHAYTCQSILVCNEDVRENFRGQEMKMTVWFEKFLPKAESGVQNGVFLQPC